MPFSEFFRVSFELLVFTLELFDLFCLLAIELLRKISGQAVGTYRRLVHQHLALLDEQLGLCHLLLNEFRLQAQNLRILFLFIEDRHIVSVVLPFGDGEDRRELTSNDRLGCHVCEEGLRLPAIRLITCITQVELVMSKLSPFKLFVSSLENRAAADAIGITMHITPNTETV